MGPPRSAWGVRVKDLEGPNRGRVACLQAAGLTRKSTAACVAAAENLFSFMNVDLLELYTLNPKL